MLETQYDPDIMKKSADLMRKYERSSIWRYRDLFPPVRDESIVSLGEGGTPLVRSRAWDPPWGFGTCISKTIR